MPSAFKTLTNWALATMPYARKAAAAANIPSPPTYFSGTSRRRSSSVPDAMRGLPPTKKRRLAESTFLFTPVAEDRTKVQDQKGSQFPWASRGGARPSHDSIGDAEFRQHVLNQLGERIKLKASKPGSWGETNDRAMFQLVSAASQPNLDGDDDEVDAYFLTGEEAAARVECTKQQVRNQIITMDRPLAPTRHLASDLVSGSCLPFTSCPGKNSRTKSGSYGK